MWSPPLETALPSLFDRGIWFRNSLPLCFGVEGSSQLFRLFSVILAGLLGSCGLAPSLPEARVSADPAIPVKTKVRGLLPAIPCICACTDGMFTSNCFNLLMQQKSRQVNRISVVS